jgi:hemoglobin
MKYPARVLVALSVLVGLAGCGGTARGPSSLFEQAGGMSQIRALSDSFVGNVARDTRTSQLVANADQTALKSKMSNQLCAMTGGTCAAPLTDAQITDAARKVDAPTSRALSESFSGALDAIKAVPGVKDAMTKAIGGKLPGILAGLL